MPNSLLAVTVVPKLVIRWRHIREYDLYLQEMIGPRFCRVLQVRTSKDLIWNEFSRNSFKASVLKLAGYAKWSKTYITGSSHKMETNVKRKLGLQLWETTKNGAGEMSRVITALTENPNFFLSTQVRQHRTACCSFSRKSNSFSVLRLKHSHEIPPHRHMQIKNKTNAFEKEIVSYFGVIFSSGRNRHGSCTEV